MYLFYTMKYLLLSFLLLLMVLPACAQHENWDTYMARYGSKPGSVLVDMGLMATAPQKLLPYLVITGPHAKNCYNPQGIPDTGEINKMETILGVAGGVLSGATARKLAGTFTYNCERLNYYYVQDTTAIRKSLNRVYQTYYPDYKYTLKIKYDPQWVSYRSFLYPDSSASAWMANNKAMTSLLVAGDDLQTPRSINHTLYFMDDSGRTEFARYAASNGYAVVSTNKSPNEGLAYELVIGRTGRVILDSIVTMESDLTRVAKPLKGYYKGWDAKK